MKKLIYIFSVFLLFNHQLNAQNWDADLIHQINLQRNPSYDQLMIGVSQSVAPIAVALPLSMFIYSKYKNDTITLKHSILIVTSIVGSIVISTALKYSINRTRPYITYPELEKLDAGGGPSFPSAHTSTAFALATSLSMQYPRWYVYIPAYTWASSVGYSRIYVGVHYPSDVFIGACVGTLSAFLSEKINKKLFR